LTARCVSAALGPFFRQEKACRLTPITHQPEGPSLEAVAEGFRRLGFKDDHAQNAAEWIVCDALYAYCREMVRCGNPEARVMIRKSADTPLMFNDVMKLREDDDEQRTNTIPRQKT
jgi:hypothetical protein